MASNSDTFHPPSGGFDSSTMESGPYSTSPRPRLDSNNLLVLPAPLAANRQPMSSSSTVGMSRSSDDHYYSDATSSNLRLIPSSPSAEQYSEYDSPSPGQRHQSPGRYDTPPRSASRQRTNSADPFRSVTTSPTSYEESNYTTEPEEMAGGQRPGGRGVRLTDGGPVPGPEGVRRVSRPQGRRPSSQAPQNRYSRGSVAYLPPGAAAPQSGYGGN